MQYKPSKPFMNDHIKKAAERLLTGHYAPQDVIDVCRAATEGKEKGKKPRDPSPPPTRWVSVKDMLPENGQRVVAHYAGVYNHRVVEFWYNDPEHYHFGSPHEPDGRGSQPATHWHPLPAIPS